jgi:hypothetical protein
MVPSIVASGNTSRSSRLQPNRIENDSKITVAKRTAAVLLDENRFCKEKGEQDARLSIEPLEV